MPAGPATGGRPRLQIGQDARRAVQRLRQSRWNSCPQMVVHKGRRPRRRWQMGHASSGGVPSSSGSAAGAGLGCVARAARKGGAGGGVGWGPGEGGASSPAVPGRATGSSSPKRRLIVRKSASCLVAGASPRTSHRMGGSAQVLMNPSTVSLTSNPRHQSLQNAPPSSSRTSVWVRSQSRLTASSKDSTHGDGLVGKGSCGSTFVAAPAHPPDGSQGGDT